MTADVVVVGAGISGLVAAHRLADDAHVTLLEAGTRPGGKILTSSIDGVRVEAGPDAFLCRRPEPVRLCEELGIADELIPPAIFGAHIWLDSGLRRVPPGFLYGIPSNPFAALRSGVLSPRGAARAALDLVLPKGPFGDDVSVARFVRHRFGSEVLDHLVDPLLAGTRAGRVEELSLAAALPQVEDLARRHRSLTLGMMRSKDDAGPPPFLGLRKGMQQLVSALVDSVEKRATLETNAPVTGLERAGDRWRLHSTDESIEADAVVLAIPAPAAGRLLRPIAPQAASALSEIRYGSVATVMFSFAAGSLPLPNEASGLLVPSAAGRTLAAATWYTRKWPHVSRDGGPTVVKCFAGRAADDRAVAGKDAILVERLVTDLGDALGVELEPRAQEVVRWRDALPQYELGHLTRVARAELALEATPGVALAGAGYRGSGIPDCILSADESARRVRQALSALQKL